MEILRIILSVIFVIDCIGLTVVVMFQESKGAGLGALAEDVPWKVVLQKHQQSWELYSLFLQQF